ncbi:hypothetical protein QCA50_002363 [Cerrena zonata]|uniref:HORMA domain-containing protein n=1 Tax=Cerrena zonata TaxID=2478898 RepID=A0AAW0GNJ4_9APHY
MLPMKPCPLTTPLVEVAIHTILYVRQVYPADVFVRRKKYNTPVFQSRHPGLNDYISGAVKAVTDELALGNVDKVILVIKNKEEIALERFIFAVRNMIEVEPFNKETSVEDAMTASTLGLYFRSFLTKLSLIEAQLGDYPLPGMSLVACGPYASLLRLLDDLSFAIVLELKDDKAPAVSKGKDPPPWVPATTLHTTAGASDEAELHLLRAVDTGIISLSLAVQESEQKLEIEKKKLTKGKEKAT